MKKLFCIALLSVAISANANNNKEIKNNIYEEVKIEKNVLINLETFEKELIEIVEMWVI